MDDPSVRQDPKAVVRRGYDQISHAYRDDLGIQKKGYPAWLDRYLLARLAPPARVLDLGCGNGVPATRILAEHYEVIGVDISDVQVDRARRLVPAATFLRADIAELEFPPSSFDAIVCFFALIHIPVEEQPGIIQRIGDWLKPEGLFLATVGHDALTRTGDFYGASMYWSHADASTYCAWLAAAGIDVVDRQFIPEDPHGGHELVFGERTSKPVTQPDRVLYDRIGKGYGVGRNEDPRLAAAIHRALGDSRTVINVGAGIGSYEPADRDVTAIEPSSVMIAQRRPGSAPVVQARAENLPFGDSAFDASMAVLSDHHWTDRLAGLREMRRVARSRVVLFQWDIRFVNCFWLTRDYLPDFRRKVAGGMTAEDLAIAIGGGSVETFAIPHDIQDGFLSAYWRRPEAYLDPNVLRAISVFALMPASDVDIFVARLRADLDSGDWHHRNAEILHLPEMDLGCRLVVG